MYDALLLVSFGGPEGPDDVMPFLENVLRGKNVPRERMLEVAEHYQHFDGVSPINAQCRALLAAIREDFREHGLEIPIYWGNRNWDPYLVDTIQQMADDGVKRAAAFFTSVFSCYSGCRQYRENIEEAREKVGASAPVIEKLRMPYNHPGFIRPQIEILNESLAKVPADNRSQTPVLFCAHSIPMSMADHSRYEQQLREASRLTAEGASHDNWELAFQSRSGPPQQPWLEPDICDRIEELADQAAADSRTLTHLIVQPIGFVSDHMEVMFDLDEEAKETCEARGIELIRSETIGLRRDFVAMVRELLIERMTESSEKPALGQYGPNHDVCPQNCCLYPRTRPAATPPATSES